MWWHMAAYGPETYLWSRHTESRATSDNLELENSKAPQNMYPQTIRGSSLENSQHLSQTPQNQPTRKTTSTDTSWRDSGLRAAWWRPFSRASPAAPGGRRSPRMGGNSPMTETGWIGWTWHNSLQDINGIFSGSSPPGTSWLCLPLRRCAPTWCVPFPR